MKQVLITGVVLFAVAPAGAQSIQTDGNIETDAQLVSNAATGTAPLIVSSATMVPSLNADQVDGLEGVDLALDADLQSAEAMLVVLQAQVDALGLARSPRTGQTTCYDEVGTVVACGTGIGLGQDGDLQLGITWPNPRFTDNGDGTVTDHLTGFIWLDDASCLGNETWADALTEAAALFDGCTDCGGTNNDCGLTDGSVAGEWRLPNVRELQSLVHYGVSSPALPDTSGTGQWSEGDPFSGVQSVWYWSSSSLVSGPAAAWFVSLSSGLVHSDSKGDAHLVWAVRGGQ